ncbi:hypothetical protein DM806_12900 [Sphingobium lactosutens]|uniref:hypothetical protein n=1 Tax=Sphingobium lactosutens TaxID=522773 RepID=UPI0015BC0783|nr:hypothetical protein [Sphingobium lactosutens]NWK96542.1 hypothetical protein [Sphingobium lactosutens]
MKANPGHRPSDAVGKRVRVWLAHGGEGATYHDAPAAGWAADDCNWSIQGWPYDIAFYEVLR